MESPIIRIKDIRSVSVLHPAMFASRDLALQEMLHLLRLTGSLWEFDYQGGWQAPHVKTTNGRCTDKYFNLERLLHYVTLREIMAGQMVRAVRREYRQPIGVVVSSDHKAATLSAAVARLIGAERHEFAEKKEREGVELQIWERLMIHPREIALIAEEIINDGATTRRLMRGIQGSSLHRQHFVTFAPIIVTLVLRSALTEVDGLKIVPVFRLTDAGSVWDREKCPLHEAGSESFEINEETRPLFFSQVA
jgi:orotate phosphoribosyltransferase